MYIPETPPQINSAGFDNFDILETQLREYAPKENADTPKSALTAYARASNIAFSFVVPMVAGAVGGNFIVEKFHLFEALKIVFILLGVVFGIVGGIKSAGQLSKVYSKQDKILSNSAEKLRNLQKNCENDYYSDYYSDKKFKL